MSECSHLSTPLQQICEGKAEIPLKKINAYRSSWGLPPLEEGGLDIQVIHDGKADVPVSTVVPATAMPLATSKCGCGVAKPIVHEGPGTELKDIMTKAGVPSCQACKDLAYKMDSWGVDECRLRIDEIVEDILPRALKWVEKQYPWANTLFPSIVKEAELRRRIRKYVKMALVAYEKKNRKFHWKRSNLPMIRIIPAVRTSHRDNPTLPRTLTSLQEAGFENTLVFAEPNSPPGDYYRVFSQQMLPFRSFVETAQTLINDFPDQWYLICEDDVDFQVGCADFLRTLPLGKDQVLTLYISQNQSRRSRATSGFSRLEGDIHGSLAYLIHAESLKKILLSKTLATWENTARVDKVFCLATTECKIDLVTHVPTLAQHIGETSTLNSNRKLNSGRISNFQKEKTPLPLLTLITPTGDRQEAFTLCERWMKNQRYQGEIQWIVIDDGHTPTPVTMGQEYIRIQETMKEHSLCRNLRAAFPHIRGDNILIIEDDDYYGPDYLSAMVGQLAKADLVGERGAKYYFIRHQKWYHYLNHTHVSLCRTGMTSRVLPILNQVITGTEHPSVDIRLWETWQGSTHTWQDPDGESRMCVGIKGVAGRGSIGHRPRSTSSEDPGKMILQRWVGDDWKAWQGLLPSSSNALAYSVNLNNYDAIRPLGPQRIPVAMMSEPGIDTQGYIHIPTRSNNPKFDSRQYKILGCHYFPDAEWVAYFDSQLHPIKPVHEWINWMKSHGDADMYVYFHHHCHSIYEEAEAVIKVGKASAHVVNAQMDRYRSQGVPESGGMYLGGIHLRRNTPAMLEFEQLWWNEVKNGSHRDQLSLPVAIARSNIKVIAMEPLGFHRHFIRHRHGGGREMDDRPQIKHKVFFEDYMAKPSKRKNVTP